MGQGHQRRLFAASTGLNTVTDPTRINYDDETGISDLGVAVNITVDETGWISRREGQTLRLAGDPHSMYSDGKLCVFVDDSYLYQLLPDYSRVPIHQLTTNARMAYTHVNSNFYYTNAIDYGIVQADGTHKIWEALQYVGPPINRVFDGPRAGNHLAFFAGRMFVADGPEIWWSEPYAFSWFDRARSYVRFPTNVRMIKAVAHGLFVSDEKQTFFLAGQNPKDFTAKVVAPYPVVEWSEAIDYVETWEIGLDNLEPGLCAVWASLEGACLGTANGVFINLNKKKVIYPERGTYGASLVKGYHFIHSIGG